MSLMFESMTRRKPGGAAPCWILLLAMLLPSCVFASAWSQKVRMDNDRIVSIQVSSMIEKIPPHGYYPLRIHIKNNRDQPGRWSFQFQSSGSYDEATVMSYAEAFVLGANDEKTFEVMMPVFPVNVARYAYPRLAMDVIGPGTLPDSRVRQSSSYRTGIGSFVGISEKLAARNIGALESRVATQSVAITFTRVALDHMADDLRAYACLDQMMMMTEEWESMSFQHRYLFKQWIALGGTLFLCGPPTDALNVPADLRSGMGNWPERWHLGWGKVLPLNLGDRQSLNVEETVDTLSKTASMQALSSTGYRINNWPLRKEIPSIEQPRTALIITAVAIALIIGPINLFVAHRRKRQIQLLWTTPAISIVVSFLIAVSIVLSDGFGGYGHRMMVSCLLPEDQLEVILQEQVCRTGVLLSRDFKMTPAQFITMVESEDFRKTTARFRYTSDNITGGSWFTSRSIQGHIIQKSQPSRARVELWRNAAGDDGPPEIFSAINETLRTIYVVDRDGNCWRSERIHAGESKPLVSISKSEFNQWLKTTSNRGGGHVRKHFGNLAAFNGMFYAEVDNPENVLFATLPSIRWQQQQAIVMGPVSEEGSP